MLSQGGYVGTVGPVDLEVTVVIAVGGLVWFVRRR